MALSFLRTLPNLAAPPEASRPDRVIGTVKFPPLKEVDVASRVGAAKAATADSSNKITHMKILVSMIISFRLGTRSLSKYHLD